MKTNNLFTPALRTTAVAVGLLLAGVAQAHHLPEGTFDPLPRTPIVYKAIASVTDESLMLWAQQALPMHFPGPSKTIKSADYTFRYYNIPNVGENYIAVTNDSKVYVLGTVTKSKLTQFGVLNDFTDMVFPGRGVSHTYPAGSLEARYFAEINDARIRGGFPAYKQDARLDQAASNHMKYFDNAFGYVALLPYDFVYDGKHYKGALDYPNWDSWKWAPLDPVTNQLAAHSETAGKPFFTGAQPNERGLAAGYSGTVGEVMAFGSDAQPIVVIGLLNTVFHRQGVLDLASTDIGIGCAIKEVTDLRVASSENHACVLNSAYQTAASLPADWIGVYPGNGQTDVPTNMDGEVPHPVPEYPVIGAPISIHIDIQDKGRGYHLDPNCPPSTSCPSIQEQAFHATSFTVTSADGVAIVGKLLDNKLYGAISKGNIFFAPKGPLVKNTTYTVKFVGKETKFNGSFVRDVVKTWTFSTGNMRDTASRIGNKMVWQSLLATGQRR